MDFTFKMNSTIPDDFSTQVGFQIQETMANYLPPHWNTLTHSQSSNEQVSFALNQESSPSLWSFLETSLIKSSTRNIKCDCSAPVCCVDFHRRIFICIYAHIRFYQSQTKIYILSNMFDSIFLNWTQCWCHSMIILKTIHWTRRRD